VCTTQKLTIPDGKGGTVEVEDTQDCGKKTCGHSIYYDPDA
jgi:hypothetical protein